MKPQKPDPNEQDRKSFKFDDVTIKQDEEGEVTGEITARIATFGVVDKDGDMLMQGSVGRQDVLISQWSHASTIMSQRVVGKGVVFEEGDGLYFEGQYNMELQDAVDDFKAVRFSGNLLEWSFGLIPEDYSFEERDDDYMWGRDIRRMRVFEVSPVIVGAGVGTGTIAAKAAKPSRNNVDALATASAVKADMDRRSREQWLRC